MSGTNNERKSMQNETWETKLEKWCVALAKAHGVDVVERDGKVIAHHEQGGSPYVMLKLPNEERFGCVTFERQAMDKAASLFSASVRELVAWEVDAVVEVMKRDKRIFSTGSRCPHCEGFFVQWIDGGTGEWACSTKVGEANGKEHKMSDELRDLMNEDCKASRKRSEQPLLVPRA